MIVAIFGMIIFLIGALGVAFYGVAAAFSAGILPGCFSLVILGIIVMLIGSVIESEL